MWRRTWNNARLGANVSRCRRRWTVVWSGWSGVLLRPSTIFRLGSRAELSSLTIVLAGPFGGRSRRFTTAREDPMWAKRCGVMLSMQSLMANEVLLKNAEVLPECNLDVGVAGSSEAAITHYSSAAACIGKSTSSGPAQPIPYLPHIHCRLSSYLLFLSYSFLQHLPLSGLALDFASSHHSCSNVHRSSSAPQNKFRESRSL